MDAYDFSKILPYSINVTNICVRLALFLGYSEIILLGLDYNWMASIFDQHCYDEEKVSLCDEIYQTYVGSFISCWQHDILANIAKENGVSIMNATKDSFLYSYDSDEALTNYYLKQE